LRYWRFCQAGPVSFKIGRHIRYERRDVHACGFSASETQAVLTSPDGVAGIL
jgi:hypothetical protein